MSHEDSIECSSYRASVVTARDSGSGMATGRRQHLLFSEITWIYTNGGVSASDSARGVR